MLLIEDDARVRGATARFLRHYGYVVVETADGAAALNYLREDGSADVIVLSLEKPVNLPTLLESVRAVLPSA